MPTHQVDKWLVALAVWPEPSVCISKNMEWVGLTGGEGGEMTQREIGKTRELAWKEFNFLLQKFNMGFKNAELDADFKIVQVV